MTQIYVGFLPQDMDTRELYHLFAQHGFVESVILAEDPKTGVSKGFGFLEMPENDARKAIQALNGQRIRNSKLKVEESRPKPDARQDDEDLPVDSIKFDPVDDE